MSQINVNTIKDKSGLGAPSFPNGVNATGVITATSFSGDGGNLTGIDASSLKVGGTTIVQASTTGLVITGVATASNFKTGSTNVHSVGVEAAGINVLGADTPIGTGSTIYDNGNASFNGNVTSDGNITAAGNVTAAGNINANGNIVGDNSTNITGINAITASGNISGADATFTGNVSVGGTLTYEDVSNIDSVGLITARGGVRVTSGGMVVAGVSTFSGALDINAGVNISGLGDFAASTFNDIRLAYSGDNIIDTSANNLILNSASGTVVASGNFITNGYNQLGSAIQNNTTYINSTTAAHSNATTLVVGHGSGNYAGMTFQCAAGYPGGVYFTDTDNGQEGGIAYYHNGDQLRFYAGSTQYMSVDSSAITAVNSVPFVGNLTGNVTGNTSGSSGSCTGNALTATTLQNARTIAGVSFNGSANISLNNNAITNGAGYITASGTAALATSVTVTANNGNNENVYLAFVDSSAGGTQGIETDAALSYNPSTNALTTTEFIGGLTGNASGTSGGFTAGNASNLNSGTVPSARLGSSGTRSSSTYLRGDNTWVDDGCFIRADAADTATGRITFSGNATSNHDDMASGTGSMGGLEVYNSASGNDAFMAFHTGSDYALYFGLDADSNSLAVGGWSMGAVKHKIIHQGNVGSGDALSGVNVYASQFHGNGASLTNLNATNIGSGTVPTNNLGSGTANNTKFLRGDSTWQETTTIIPNKLSVAGQGGNATWYPLIVSASGGNADVGTDSGFTFNPSTNVLTAGVFVGRLENLTTSNKSSSYTTVKADAGTMIRTNSGVTIGNGIYAAGDIISIYNNSGSDITITQSNTTLRKVGTSDTGNITLAERGLMTVTCVSSNEFVCSGGGMS